MSEAGAPPGAKSVSELRVSGHLMTLEPGLFCVVQSAGATGADEASGLPGVRISLPPGPMGRPDAVSISTFREDGWLSGRADAALIRVTEGPAQILVTIYQQPGAQREPPRLQLVRLGDPAQQQPQAAVPQQQQPAAAQPAPAAAAPAPGEPMVNMVAAHVQQRGDVAVPIGEWVGEPGSKRWVEGFGIAPPEGVAAEDLEYQAVLGRGWLSPWAHGGQYCGSRGMALPLLGLRVRLRGAAAETHDCALTASFVDGTQVGPVGDGAPCETEALAPLEAFRVEFRPKAGARGKAAAPQVAAEPPAASSRRAPAKAPARKKK
jgi:hypothetical protein